MVDMKKNDSPTKPADSKARRSFIVRASAVVIGAIVGLFPFAAGLGVVLNPLRRSRGTSTDGEADTTSFTRVTPLDALPADDVPREFAVVADATDAWTHASAQRIGAIFLIRSAKTPNEVTCFTATCPHLGCAVDFDSAKKEFECPCHESGFALDGKKLFGPSLRGLDPLPVKIEEKSGSKEILVKYERFKGGIAAREVIE